MSSFYITRKDPRTGRLVEVPYATIPNPNMDVNRRDTDKRAAAVRFGQALPNLLNEVDQHIKKLESTLPAEGSIQRGAADKALARFRRRRAILAQCRFPFGPSDGLDPMWGHMSDRLIPDAMAAGLVVDDSFQPSGKATVEAQPSAGLLGAIRGLAPRVAQLEHQCRVRASAADQYAAAAWAERADSLAYVIAHLETGNIPSNKYIDNIIELTSITLPLCAAAQHEGLLITVDHNENLSWVRRQRQK
jgi:hypothetical protein